MPLTAPCSWRPTAASATRPTTTTWGRRVHLPGERRPGRQQYLYRDRHGQRRDRRPGRHRRHRTSHRSRWGRQRHRRREPHRQRARQRHLRDRCHALGQQRQRLGRERRCGGDGPVRSLTQNADGSYAYAVDNGNAAVEALANSAQTLDDVFTYTASNGAGGTDTATLTITIQGANDAPEAAATSVTTDEGTAITGSLPAATDVDGDAVTYALAADATHGAVLVASNGSFSYTPDEDYSGPDVFTYRVSDGRGGSNTYAATVTVNDGNEPPVDRNSGADHARL